MYLYANTAKYLGMSLNVKLRGKETCKEEKKFNIKFIRMLWLIDIDNPRKS